MKYCTFIAVTGLILGMAAITANSADFCETNGIVSIEAEYAYEIKSWSQISGLSGFGMRDVVGKENGYMRYRITFSQTGNYTVYFMNKCSPDPGVACIDANDVFVELNGAQMISSVDNSSKVLGMRTGCSSYCWTSAPKVHDNQANLRNRPVYFKVGSTGTKTLELRSRGKGYTVDKIIFQLNNSTQPSSLGPSPTICGTSANYVSAPQINPVGGTYTSPVTVTLSSATAGADIRYTTDGSDPTGSSTLYAGSFVLNNHTTIKAKAFKSGMTASTISEAAYIVNVGGYGDIITIEAEDMTLTNYNVEGTTGGIVITDKTIVPSSGTAIETFSGATGTYQVTVTVFVENDGRPILKMYVGSSEVLNKTYPSGTSIASTPYDFVIASVNLTSSDVIKLEGTSDGTPARGAFARIDKIVFTPNAVVTPIFNVEVLPRQAVLFPNPMSFKEISKLSGETGLFFYDIRGLRNNQLGSGRPGIYIIQNRMGKNLGRTLIIK